MIINHLENYFESGIFESPSIQESGGVQLYYGGGTIIDCMNGYFGQNMWQFPEFLKPTIVIEPGPLFGKITDLSSLNGSIKGTSGLNGVIRWINS
jgi:hypothetical protein